MLEVENLHILLDDNVFCTGRLSTQGAVVVVIVW